MADDDEEGYFGGLYEDGHWDWDDDALVFISDHPTVQVEAVNVTAKVPTGAVVFRDDLDLIEQDILDLAIYTAPVQILSPILINMLHLPTMERFLRALILCNAYYLQVSEEMTVRVLELQTKLRTTRSAQVEGQFKENLSDLRVLVAKEYTVMLLGGADLKNYHHMGPVKKRRSLSNKDARLFETLLRMCVQIVWLALGRKCFHLIELEVNRLFKSEIFNSVEHHMKTGYITNMTHLERSVVLGRCLKYDKKLNSRSPLCNEVFCHREIDYRIMGLGVVKTANKTIREQYLWNLIVGDEEIFCNMNASLGIIGLPRRKFDTMLKPLPEAGDLKSKASVSNKLTKQSTESNKSAAVIPKVLYPHIVIPPKSLRDTGIPPYFPEETEIPRPVNNIQRNRWQNRLAKLLGLRH